MAWHEPRKIALGQLAGFFLSGACAQASAARPAQSPSV
ncbi:hypothetical protein ANDA3_0260 [plant metagenome]|uniref:Uncharacterized protein n=1 Tax=plant metagenome TaxID=1297885 RepID=A0A484QRZ1_9ZZZZ